MYHYKYVLHVRNVQCALKGLLSQKKLCLFVPSSVIIVTSKRVRKLLKYNNSDFFTLKSKFKKDRLR